MHYDKSERIPVATCGSRIYVQTYRVYKIKCPESKIASKVDILQNDR